MIPHWQDYTSTELPIVDHMILGNREAERPAPAAETIGFSVRYRIRLSIALERNQKLYNVASRSN
jgi:hypothetical protein